VILNEYHFLGPDNFSILGAVITILDDDDCPVDDPFAATFSLFFPFDGRFNMKEGATENPNELCRANSHRRMPKRFHICSLSDTRCHFPDTQAHLPTSLAPRNKNTCNNNSYVNLN
jgi:hypothetical protein